MRKTLGLSVPPPQEMDPWNSRSAEAKELHTYIYDILKVRICDDSRSIKTKLESILGTNPYASLELSINGFSHFHDCIHLGEEFGCQPRRIQELLTQLRVFVLQTDDIKEHFKTKILLNRTNDGFTLLQQAVTNGNIDLINLVVQWYEQAKLSNPEEFKTKILLNSTKAGFNIYHQAGMTLKLSESGEFLKGIKSLLTSKEISTLLNQKTKNGFRPGNPRNPEMNKYISDLRAECQEAARPGGGRPGERTGYQRQGRGRGRWRGRG